MLTNTIVLLIASYDMDHLQRCVVSLSEDKYKSLMITVSADDESITTCLGQLFEKHINLSFGWIKPVLVDLVKEKDNMIAYYACNIPPGTDLIDAYYISANIALIDNKARKSLSYV